MKPDMCTVSVCNVGLKYIQTTMSWVSRNSSKKPKPHHNTTNSAANLQNNNTETPLTNGPLVSLHCISTLLQSSVSTGWASCSTWLNRLTLHNPESRWDHKQKLCRLHNQQVHRSCFQNKQTCSHKDNTPSLSCRCDHSAQWEKLSQRPRSTPAGRDPDPPISAGRNSIPAHTKLTWGSTCHQDMKDDAESAKLTCTVQSSYG